MRARIQKSNHSPRAVFANKTHHNPAREHIRISPVLSFLMLESGHRIASWQDPDLTRPIVSKYPRHNFHQSVSLYTLFPDR